MKILSLNASDAGGGAEQIAWDLFKGFEAQGEDSWLLVGDKKTNDARVVWFHDNTNIDYGAYGKSLAVLKRTVVKSLCRRLGVEDFQFPLSYQTLQASGQVPDILHCHNLHGGYFDLRALAPLSRNIPVFLTLHDAWLSSGHCAYSMGCPKWQTGCGACPDLTIPPAMERDATAWNWRNKAKILKQCRLYVSSPSEWLLSRMRDSILTPAIVEARVIPHGIDLERFRPASKREARVGLDVPRDGFLIVTAASSFQGNPFKDLNGALAVAQLLGETQGGAAMHLAVVGSSGATQRAGNLTIHHLPRMPHEKLATYFQAADLYLHVARAEAFGLVIAEAMACGTPVVAFDADGIPEVVRDGETGILVPRGDHAALAAAMRTLLHDTKTRVAMSEAAACHARLKFCRTRMVQDHLNWYREHAGAG